jgi:hypothetical protein
MMTEFLKPRFKGLKITQKPLILYLYVHIHNTQLYWKKNIEYNLQISTQQKPKPTNGNHLELIQITSHLLFGLPSGCLQTNFHTGLPATYPD